MIYEIYLPLNFICAVKQPSLTENTIVFICIKKNGILELLLNIFFNFHLKTIKGDDKLI